MPYNGVLMSSETVDVVQKEYRANTVVRGDGVAQLVERQTRDPKDRGLNPVRNTRTICELYRFKILC